MFHIHSSPHLFGSYLERATATLNNAYGTWRHVLKTDLCFAIGRSLENSDLLTIERIQTNRLSALQTGDGHLSVRQYLHLNTVIFGNPFDASTVDVDEADALHVILMQQDLLNTV